MGLLTAIEGTTVYLDANVFIYALEGYERFRRDLSQVSGLLVNGSSDSDTIRVNIEGLSPTSLPNGLWLVAGEGTGDDDILQLEGSTPVFD